ncbi:MAG: sulfotransferase [Bacteroidetes bacterium]|nr:sulfotransferase [Bacteroidota bacterium]
MNSNKDQINFIFILGITPRTGTHYLMSLLCLHPDCLQSAIPEDALIMKSNVLMQYVARNLWQWEHIGDFPEIDADKLLTEELGKGLLNFLRQVGSKTSEALNAEPGSGAKYLVTKTPNVNNLKNFFKLFPNERLLILVRDGRDLAESNYLTFKHPREETIREWANAARSIFRMQEKWSKEGRKFLVVKYEDLYQDTELEMKKILSFLGLEGSKYDFDKALNAPVIGSSVFQRNGEVNWQPVTKTEEFNPMSRSAGWSRWQHERFNWLASNELKLFGYELIEFKNKKLFIVLKNYLYDAVYAIKAWGKKIRKYTLFVWRKLKLQFKSYEPQ